MNKRNKWTDTEIELLKNNYTELGAKKLNDILDNHSYLSIVKKAKILNLNYKKSNYNEIEILKIVKNCYSYADLFRKLDKVGTGDSYKCLKKFIKDKKIDISHFDPYKNNRINAKYKTIDQWLQCGTTLHSSHLKNKLYKEGLKERKCEKCGQGEDWNGEHMSLILDHINGINNDNRLENLRILCPNCNATLPTHCRGNVRKEQKKYEKKVRLDDGFTLKEKNAHLKQRKIERPPYPQLISEIKELGYRGTGKKYGVSDNAIRKWKYIYEKYN